MATPALDDARFPMARCGSCEREVITYVDLDERGEERRRCLHCDDLLTECRDVDADDLEAAGYALIEARGCGNGGGCSSGCGQRR